MLYPLSYARLGTRQGLIIQPFPLFAKTYSHRRVSPQPLYVLAKNCSLAHLRVLGLGQSEETLLRRP